MDSYTDVSGHCCNFCGRPNCSGHCGAMRPDPMPLQPFYDQNWTTEPAFRTGGEAAAPAASFPFPPAPAPTPAPLCPNTGVGPLEQNYPVAMAYVPWQQWQATYPLDHALLQGTIFPDLDLQFDYGRCGR